MDKIISVHADLLSKTQCCQTLSNPNLLLDVDVRHKLALGLKTKNTKSKIESKYKERII